MKYQKSQPADNPDAQGCDASKFIPRKDDISPGVRNFLIIAGCILAVNLLVSVAGTVLGWHNAQQSAHTLRLQLPAASVE